MRKKLQLVASLSLLAFSYGYSQTGRYLTEVFPSVTVTSDVVYGTNYSQSILTGGNKVATPLKMDVYQPTGDSHMARPLVIVLHTGSFMPAVVNGQATGSKTDSAVVVMCTQFAKRGYVAVAADYRLGWNPTATGTAGQDIRTGTLLQAVYRSIQDAKTCVRYFKNDKVTADTYKIDTFKIAVGGLGSGGYIALAYGSLNQVSELMLPKFLDNSGGTPVPYINQDTLGNFDGTNTTPYCTPNYANHTSTINMVFNVGGAVGDTSWIQAGEVPVVSLHCTKDPNGPYKTGSVIVPNTGDFVVQASGSYDVIRIVNKSSIDNNADLNSSLFTDTLTDIANTRNDGLEGLYPFITPAPGAALNCTGAASHPQKEQGSPWDWWNETAYAAAPGHPSGAPGSVMVCLNKVSNPDMSATKGRLYIDTIQGYLNPRIVCALALPGCVPDPTGINENVASSEITIYPNPSTSEINFSVKGSNTIKSVELYDVTGRMVKQISGLNAQKYTVQREELSSGLYITKIKLNNGLITKRIILE